MHGDESGSVDQRHNLPGSRLLGADPQRAAEERQRMRNARVDQAPYLLDRGSSAIVREALREVCLHRGWSLLAAHARTNHVRVIVEAEVRPERVMNDFKSYASRNLNRLGSEERDRKRWARHAFTHASVAVRDGYERIVMRLRTFPCAGGCQVCH